MSTIVIDYFAELYISKKFSYPYYMDNEVIATVLFEFFLKKKYERTDANRDVISGFFNGKNMMTSDIFNKLFSFVRTNFDALESAWNNFHADSTGFKQQLGELMHEAGL